MAGQSRKTWQSFKKKCPEFTRIQGKQNLGPALDKIDKQFAIISKAMQVIEGGANELVKQTAIANKAIEIYRALYRKRIKRTESHDCHNMYAQLHQLQRNYRINYDNLMRQIDETAQKFKAARKNIS